MKGRGRSSQRRQRWAENPVRLTIENLSHEGRGVGRVEGKTVFVTGALPGESVEAIYTNRRSKFDEAKLFSVEQASTDRVNPPCAHADLCGGCSLQHFDPVQAVAFKQDVLQEQLQHFASKALSEGKVDFLPPLQGPTTGYRRRARLAVKSVSNKGVLVGFREKAHRYVANISACEVLDPRVAVLINPLKALVAALSVSDKLPQIEVACGDVASQEDAPSGVDQDSAVNAQAYRDDNAYDHVALIVRHLEPLTDEDHARLRDFADQHELAIYLQPKGIDTVHKLHPLNTPERLTYALEGFPLRFFFHPTDFTQVNADINQKMVRKAIALMDLKPDDRVLDLFCGLGNFTLPMATVAQSVTGVEGSEEMVNRGNENVAANGLENVQFFASDLFAEPEKWQGAWTEQTFDKLLLDPPRSGAEQIVTNIEQFKVKHIVYVSCNPATLARDIGILLNQGFELVKTGVMDMFPHTTHVESIALLVKPG